MNANTPNPATPSPAAPNLPAPAAAPKRRSWLLYGCGGVLVLCILVAATVAITIWYIQRPIKPVVLTTEEKAAVEAKLDRLGGGKPEKIPNVRDETGKPTPAGADRSPASTVERSQPVAPRATTSRLPEERYVETDRVYVPGDKVLRLTEREVNGLLNANTDLGNTVRLEFARDAINAYIAAPIPEDVPVMGGKIFRARGRFRLAVTNGAPPVAILEDVTVFGLSLPNAWLGGAKGHNLLSDAMGNRDNKPVLSGVKSLRIEPGVLILEVDE